LALTPTTWPTWFEKDGLPPEIGTSVENILNAYQKVNNGMGQN